MENAVWHFLCNARVVGLHKARDEMLKVAKDPRGNYFMKIYDLFRGKAKPDDVFTAAEEGTVNTCGWATYSPVLCEDIKVVKAKDTDPDFVIAISACGDAPADPFATMPPKTKVKEWKSGHKNPKYKDDQLEGKHYTMMVTEEGAKKGKGAVYFARAFNASFSARLEVKYGVRNLDDIEWSPLYGNVPFRLSESILEVPLVLQADRRIPVSDHELRISVGGGASYKYVTDQKLLVANGHIEDYGLHPADSYQKVALLLDGAGSIIAWEFTDHSFPWTVSALTTLLASEQIGIKSKSPGSGNGNQGGGEHGAGARRGDDAGDEPHRERARPAGAADRVEAPLPRRGEPHLEGAEHRGGHEREDERHEPDHPRVLHDAAEGLPGEGRPDAERGVHERDAEDVRPGEGHRLAPGARLPGPEDRDRDRDEGVHARGQARRDAPGEGHGEREGRPLREQGGETVIRRHARRPERQEVGDEGHGREGRGGEEDPARKTHC